MTFKKKILHASVAALALAGQANAVEVVNVSVGGENAPYVMASELDIAEIADGEVTFQILTTTGSLPSGNIVLQVDLTGAAFASDVAGAAVVGQGCTIDTSVISTGGLEDGTQVRFILSGADDCLLGGGAEVTLPIRLTGGDVDIEAGFKTESNSPIDGVAETASGVITFESAFSPSATIGTSDPVLSIASDFKDFLAPNNVLGPVIGTVTVEHDEKFIDLAGNETSTADVAAVSVVVSGNFAGFASTGATATKLEVDDTAATITLTTATRSTTGATAQGFVNNDLAVQIDTGLSGGVLSASDYDVVVTATYENGDLFTATPESSGSIPLESTTREGTTLIFPWTASATLGGSNNLVRIGNLTDTDITGVYARVVNQSTDGSAAVGVLQPLNITIPGEGEVVITSASLEAALGNFGRADIEVVVEADDANLSVRRLVVRSNGNVFDFGEGKGTNNN